MRARRLSLKDRRQANAADRESADRILLVLRRLYRIPRMGREIVRKAQPWMPIIGPYRLLRLWKVAIRERSHRHSDEVRHTVRFPPKRRPAFGAEVKRNRMPARRLASVSLRRSARLDHLRPRKECGDAEQGPGPPLTVVAVTKRNLRGFATANQGKLSAMARGTSGHAMDISWPVRPQ